MVAGDVHIMLIYLPTLFLCARIGKRQTIKNVFFGDEQRGTLEKLARNGNSVKREIFNILVVRNFAATKCWKTLHG